MSETFQRALLIEESKEELVDEILRLRKEKEELAKKKEALEKELQELKGQQRSQFTTEKEKLKKRWKKLGRKEGHPGVTRPTPDHIDHVVEETLEQCPDCGSKNLIEDPFETEEHIQEDIIPARVEVTKFIRKGYECLGCHKTQKAPYAEGEVPHGYLGPNVLAQTVLLKYFYGLSYSKIQGVFEQLCSLKVSKGGLAQALQRLGKWLSVEEQVILKAIRSSPWVHGDETGWKIAGIGHWLWDWVNAEWALYRIRRGRGRKEVQEVMGTDYGGVVISDFLKVYDKTGRRRQRCWVHLLRELKKIRDPSLEETQSNRTLKRIYRDAQRLNQNRGKLAPWVFCRRRQRLEERLFDFASQSFESKTWKRLSERILKYHKEFFTFLEVPGVPSDNNHAERMIRPNVIFRKISFQNMSRKGADAHEVLMSLVESLRLQGRSVLPFLKKAYLRHRQTEGKALPLLSC